MKIKFLLGLTLFVASFFTHAQPISDSQLSIATSQYFTIETSLGGDNLFFSGMSRSVEKYNGSDYGIIYRPTTLKPKGVILFLHGIGEIKKNGGVEILEKLALPKVLGKDKIEIPYIVFAPQLNANGWWENVLVGAFEKVDALAAEYGLTTKHITGLSLGGGGTVNAAKFAYTYNGNKPGYFKSYGVVCGWMDNQITSTSKAWYEGSTWKVWHGTADPTVVYSKGVFLYDQLNKNGIPVSMVTLDNVKHDAWTHAYNVSRNDDYIQWLEEIDPVMDPVVEAPDQDDNSRITTLEIKVDSLTAKIEELLNQQKHWQDKVDATKDQLILLLNSF